MNTHSLSLSRTTCAALLVGLSLTPFASAGSGFARRIRTDSGAASPAQSDVKIPAQPSSPTPAITRIAAPGAAPVELADKVPFEKERRTNSVPLSDKKQLFFESADDGSTWVRGRAYKAQFGVEGAKFIPFFGSTAPRNYPIHFSLAGANSGDAQVELTPARTAVRDANRFVIDRGVIDEIYEVSLDSLEQRFVIEERPLSDELDLYVEVAEEYALAPHAGGIDLKCASGSVHYGQAFALSMDGSKTPLSTDIVEGRIRIHLGADVLRDADFPLVVDPVITTYMINNFSTDETEPDLAYDATTNRHLVVYEEIFSATDGDVQMQLRDQNGLILLWAYFDSSDENWRNPQTANLNAYDQFLCVAQVINVAGSTTWSVRGRTFGASSMSLGARFDISTADQSGDKILPDVGGDPYDVAPSYYCVTWHRTYTPTDTDIHARLVTSTSTLVGTGTILVDNSGASLDTWPSISKSNAGSNWTIAWFRQVTAPSTEIHAARLNWNGATQDASTSLVAALGVDYYPRVSSPTNDGRVLVVYAHDYGPDHDLHYLLLDGVTIDDAGHLTTLDASPTLFEDQVEYSIDCDGERFVVAYTESYGGSAIDHDVYVSAFARFNGSLVSSEPHVLLDGTLKPSAHTDIVAKRSGGAVSRDFTIVWDRTTSPGNRDIFGADFDRQLGGRVTSMCAGDGTGSACPCGNSGASARGCGNSAVPGGSYLGGTGQAVTGASDTLLLTAQYMPPFAPALLFQGTGGNVGFAFGDGLLCVGGTILRFGVKFSDASGSAQWPSGADPSISTAAAIPLSGALHTYQVYYRDAFSFCTSATFNLTSGLDVLWLP